MTTTAPAPAPATPRTIAAPSLRARLRALASRSIELGAAFPPGTKNVRDSGVFRTPFSRWVWKFATHRLTRAGHWFLTLTFLLGLFGAISLEIQTYIPFLYVCCFWLVAGAYALLSRPRVTVRARHAGTITAGETLLVDVEVTSARRRGPFPSVDLNVLPELLPPPVDAVPGSGVPLPPLAPGETARIRLGLLCKRRGVYALKGFRVESDFPLGLMNAYRVFPQETSLLVYPAFRPLSSFSLPAGARYQPGGVALTSHLGDSFEFLGNREFRQGDNIRDIDWRATARQPLGQPIVREWREEYFFRVGVVLDTHLPKRARPTEARARRDAFERAVSATAAVADYLARNQYIVDIFAAGPTLYHLTAGRGAAYLEQILDILACIEHTDEEPLEKVEPELLAMLGSLTSIICVFTRYDERRREFVRMLRESGAGVKVILVLPDLPGLAADADTATLAPGEDISIVDATAFVDGGGPDEL